MNLNPAGTLLIRDLDGTLATIACGTVADCTWNGNVTAMTVTLASALVSSGGSTPGLQVPAELISMFGIAEGNALSDSPLVPDLAGSVDPDIDFE
jgi:hypothetical protein